MTISAGNPPVAISDTQRKQMLLDLGVMGEPQATVWNIDDIYTPGTARKHELRGKFTTPRHPDTGKFGFATLIGNGQTYYAVGDFDAGTYDAGITGLLERVDDSVFIGDGTAEAPAANEYVWKLIISPTHVVTVGRPRVQLTSFFFTMFRTYEVEFKFRLHQPGTQGWNDITRKPFQGSIWNLTNEDFADFGVNQDASSGPLAIGIDGNKLMPLTRGLDTEMGADPSGTYNTIDFGYGDMVCAVNRFAQQLPLGLEYTTIKLRFHLDHRLRKDGGRGFFKGWFNNREWFYMTGPTTLPLMADTGTASDYYAKIGLYETSGGAATAGTLNNDSDAVPNGVGTTTCGIERSLWLQGYRIMEVDQ
jgi:hypothetical protein